MRFLVWLKSTCLVLAIGLGVGSVMAACNGEVIVPGSTTTSGSSSGGEGYWEGEGYVEGEGAWEGYWEGEGGWEGEGAWEGAWEGAPEPPIFDAGTTPVLDAGVDFDAGNDG